MLYDSTYKFYLCMKKYETGQLTVVSDQKPIVGPSLRLRYSLSIGSNIAVEISYTDT